MMLCVCAGHPRAAVYWFHFMLLGGANKQMGGKRDKNIYYIQETRMASSRHSANYSSNTLLNVGPKVVSLSSDNERYELVVVSWTD